MMSENSSDISSGGGEVQRVPYKKRYIINALLDNYGNLKNASASLGVTRDKLYKTVKKDQTGDYAGAINQGKAYLVDDTESNIGHFIQKKDKSMTKFVAETLGKERGYFKKKALDNHVLGELDLNTKISGEVKVVIERKIVMSRQESDDFMNQVFEKAQKKTKEGEVVNEVTGEVAKKIVAPNLLDELDISELLGGA